MATIKQIHKQKWFRKTRSKRQRGSGACHSLECRDDVNAKDDYGSTALHREGEQGDVEEVLSLLEQPGIDVNMKNNNGRTTLIIASRCGRTEIVAMLLEKGADLDAKDNNGKTALMEASTSGRTEIVQMLLNKGADLDAKDNMGYTALMMVQDENIYFPEVETAIVKQNKEIARILRREAQERHEALFGVALRLGTEKSNTSAARVLGQTVKVKKDGKELDIHHFANEINKYAGGRKSSKKTRKIRKTRKNHRKKKIKTRKSRKSKTNKRK
jgi:uncharacterized protein